MAVEQTVGRVVRQMRALRVERLAPVQRLAQEWTQSVREWLGQRLRRDETTQRVTARQSVTQTQQVTQRQSRGIRM